jgi:polysaccharide biosynthesis/export protein
MSKFIHSVFVALLAAFVMTFAVPGAALAQAAETDAGYVLGPGDVIEVSVLGQSEFTTRARVRSDGTIVLPFVGSTKVSGETSVTLAKSIGATLAKGGYYVNPIVNIEIASYASRYVIVLGSVATPGLQPVDRAYRLSEIIARAGGIRADGADYVVLRRQTGEEAKLPFDKLASGTNADDPFVGPGDKVYVPAAETYYIYGQINAPGAYPLKDNMTLRKALARGAGLTATGSEKRITVFRNGVKQAMNLEAPILPGDVIVIGERLF